MTWFGALQPMRLHLAPRHLGTKPPPTRAIILDIREPPWARENDGLVDTKLGPADKHKLTLVITPLGLVVTHDPDDQAPFSCWHPLSATPTALADKGVGRAWYFCMYSLMRSNLESISVQAKHAA
jgi:hypothetical protein